MSKEKSPLGGIDQKYVWKLVKQCKPDSVGKGKTLFVRGKKIDRLIHIESGELEILDDENHVVDRFCEGQYLFEIPFLSADSACPYSVKVGSSEECVFSSIKRKKFDQFVNGKPGLLWKLAADLTRMIEDNNNRLKDTPAYALQLACEHDNVLKAQEVLTTHHNLNLDVPCPVQNSPVRGAHPLHLAALHNSVSVFEFLLARKADMNAVDLNGNTAAHIAARAGYIEILRLLKANDANLCLENGEHETPLKLARMARFQTIVDLLWNPGCALDESRTDSTTNLGEYY